LVVEKKVSNEAILKMQEKLKKFAKDKANENLSNKDSEKTEGGHLKRY